MKNKKAAMEMSVGTIVTIVLLMSVLVLGLMMVKNIFGSAKSAVDLTDQQLMGEIEKMYSENTRVAVYPDTRLITAKHGELTGAGIGIRNLLPGQSGTSSFRYEVSVMESDCGGNADAPAAWIGLGKTANDLLIPVGGIKVYKVRITVPIGAPICNVRYAVNVFTDDGLYDSDFFDVTVAA